MIKFTFIDAHRAEFPVVDLCRVGGVSTSGFYDLAPAGQLARVQSPGGRGLLVLSGPVGPVLPRKRAAGLVLVGLADGCGGQSVNGLEALRVRSRPCGS